MPCGSLRTKELPEKNFLSLVYATTGDSYSNPVATTSDSFVAFNMGTGKLAWSRQVTENDAYTVDCPMPAEMRGNCPGDTARF